MNRLRKLARDEGGATLVELIAGMFAGMIVFAMLATLIVVTLNTTNRVSARVHATQNARLTLTKMVNQLHSACIAPRIAPIKDGSTATELRFIHATGSAVSPTPTETRIAYANGRLTQRDYAWKKGGAPLWEFQTTPSRTVLLNEGISPVGSKPIFTYYKSVGGTPSPLTPPIDSIKANEAIQVSIAFMASATSGKAEDATPARIQGSATMRLTAVTYSTSAPSQPCQ